MKASGLKKITFVNILFKSSLAYSLGVGDAGGGGEGGSEAEEGVFLKNRHFVGSLNT